jgi:hypothetical protein
MWIFSKLVDFALKCLKPTPIENEIQSEFQGIQGDLRPEVSYSSTFSAVDLRVHNQADTPVATPRIGSSLRHEAVVTERPFDERISRTCTTDVLSVDRTNFLSR